MIVCILLFALALAACGDNESASKRAMEVKFDRTDFAMGNMENLNSGLGPELTNATKNDIVLVRKYADPLGLKEARRRLLEKRDEVAPYCLPGSATLDFEASRYRSS
jgi:hypothetical protein